MIHFDLDDQPVLNQNGGKVNQYANFVCVRYHHAYVLRVFIGKRFSDEKIQDRKTSTETNFTN